ncbi:MAG: trigger factor [Gammaproteobacteria bacterium]|nr:trigger factor [Gammaproteobacteria bacterium]MBT8150084.1 trigger factor [Gammaproteobacteria bacterium]NND38734.1 trigger factor [Pseudomonadales bacterium]NNM12198.1 trigger factor [Pseudomonadales bacterium]
MQVSVETLSSLERKLTLAIPADEIDSEVQKRVIDTAKKVRLDGFRPGKVPRKVVQQRFGDALRAEVVGEVANQSFQQAVTQESLTPVGTPKIDFTRNETGADLEVVATFEVFPEIELADPSNLKVEKFNASVTDTDVDAMIEKLRAQRGEWNEVDRAAKDGDQVNIDFLGTRDGEPFDGGSADAFDLTLGEGKMITGFESGLEGAKAGDERNLKLTFPSDYHAEELAGANVEFAVTVNAVKEMSKPELDATFFAAFEVDGGYDEFRDKVSENMHTQLADAIESHLKQQVMDGLVEQNEVELPGVMIEQEIEALREQTISRFGGNAEDFDRSLLPDEMFTEQAHKRVALGVILNHLVKQYEIRPEREQIIEFIDDIAQSYENPDEVRNLYMSDESRLQQVNMMVVEKLVVEKITEMAEPGEKTGSYDEVMAANQAASQP